MPGTPREISYLEDRFQTGDKPTEQDFQDLFASFSQKLASPAQNVTSAISSGSITISCANRRDTEVYLKTDGDLNILWSDLVEGGIIYLRIERTTTTQIALNFNGDSNQDCFMDGSSQQIGVGSPLLLGGHAGSAGINRRHYRLSIEAVKDITANKLIYLIRVSDTGSIIV